MDLSEQFVIPNLHYLAQHPTGFKGTMLEPADLERCCPLDNGRHDKQDTTTLGNLQALPVELIYTILLDLDLQSLTSLRRVNRRTRFTIDTLWQYNEIISYASSSLRAALSLNVGSSISCRQLHTEMCSQECVTCGRFGAFLYLLTCSRVCYVCLVEDRRFLPLTPKHAGIAFGLSSHETRKLPTATTLPGIYSNNSNLRRTRIALVDRASSHLAGIGFHKSVEQMEDYVSRLQAKKIFPYETNAQNTWIASSRNQQWPAYTQVFDGKGENPYRFMCVVRFPWLNRSKSMIEWGIGCKGCRDDFPDRTDERLDWRWLYTLSGYVKHVGQCKKAIEILESIM